MRWAQESGWARESGGLPWGPGGWGRDIFGRGHIKPCKAPKDYTKLKTLCKDPTDYTKPQKDYTKPKADYTKPQKEYTKTHKCSAKT